MFKKKTAKLIIAAIAAIILATCCTWIFFSAVNSGVEMRNRYLNVHVQHDKKEYGYDRFVLFDARCERPANIESELMYSRFYSSYTTLYINGQEYQYGTGKRVIEPYYNSDEKSIISCESFEGINIIQKLSFAQGYSTVEDMLKVTYEIDNQSELDANVGIRFMIDPMLYDDDNAVISVRDSVLSYETELKDDIMPEEWFVQNKNKDITVYGITDCDTPPDIFQAANWNNLYNNQWKYITSSQKISDCAISFIWNPENLAPNEKLEVSTRYGFKTTESGNIDVTEAPTTSSGNIDVTEAPTTSPSENQTPDTADTFSPFAAVIVILLSIMTMLVCVIISFKRKEVENK